MLFKELESRFGLDEINTTDAYIIEALITIAAIPLMISRVTVDELRSVEAKQREVEAAADADESALRLACCRYSLTVERYAQLIQSYLILELGTNCRIWTSCCCGRPRIQTHTGSDYVAKLNRVILVLTGTKLERTDYEVYLLGAFQRYRVLRESQTKSL